MLNRTFKATPDYLEPSVFKVGTGTGTPEVSDTDLGTAVIISGGAYIKDFISGYPILDETNLQATIRCFLNSLEANGNNLTEFGIFNEDGTPLMFSRAVHTAINKTSSVQIAYVEKDKL
ncbi:hypothetical protein K9M79_02825 [Candidatus Woesearchaeota archaeon]|nr:hypothetical protein [Candidatus Woesearchaeota archaeon]